MAPIRILILEDDHDIIDLLHSILEPHYECIDGHDGLDGLQQAILGEPDLIVCDIMMPVMDGREFIKRLRAQQGFQDVPVIFLSALGTREQIQDGYALGAALYMTKPIDPARFRRNLELFIRDHHIESRHKRRTVAQVRQAAHVPTKERSEEVTQQVRTMPRKPAATSEPHNTTGGYGSSSAKPSAARPRLLVVEDDPDACQMIRIGLSEHFEVLETGDGITAIEMAVRYKPDVFVIDGMLPRMTGYQLTVMLRKNRTFYRAPIIFISGKATPRDKQYVETLGITQFLPKPFTVAQLADALQKIVKRNDFSIHPDRIDLKQIHLEQFQHLETHRGTLANAAHEHTDRGAVERALKATVH